jgi:spore maturation protein CgeB
LKWASGSRERPAAWRRFYDIDTPVTLAKLQRGEYEYLTPQLISEYQLYLSFTGGPTLELLQDKYGSPAARPLHCSVDPELYFPEKHEQRWQLGYLGTYSADRQPVLDKLLVRPAMRLPARVFAVAGPLYPKGLTWPKNVHRVEHLPPCEHRRFYNSQRFTLNITRADMVRAGHSPSVRLFEAAACGVPIISDWWEGLDGFFTPGKEILIARTSDDVLGFVRDMDEEQRQEIGNRARRRILTAHTAAHRAAELADYARAALGK